MRAIGTLAVFTARRVLGLGRGGRHKVLPAITLAIAFLPALVSVAFAVILDDIPVDDLISYGDYTFIIGSALALFASLIAPEALCPDRRSGMLGLYLAGPLDRNRYLAGKAVAVVAVMLLITLGPLLFMLVGVRPRRARARRPATRPVLLLRILASGVVTALFYASLSMAVSSFTTRRAAAAVATVLLFFVPGDSWSAPRSRAPMLRTSSTCSASRSSSRSSRTGSSARRPTTESRSPSSPPRRRHERCRGGDRRQGSSSAGSGTGGWRPSAEHRRSSLSRASSPTRCRSGSGRSSPYRTSASTSAPG